MHEYDLIAEWYAAQRSDATGVPETVALASSLAPRSLILDIGCGNGIPITRALLSHGHRVVGIDTSRAMLARFRHNCPETFAVLGSIQRLPVKDRSFDAAVAWGVIFHLTPDDAVEAIASVSRILKDGAPLLFTSGDVDDADGKNGEMNGIPFRYFSYGVENYRRILRDHDLDLIKVHRDSGDNTYYLAKKTVSSY